jgi:hypothetical protein
MPGTGERWQELAAEGGCKPRRPTECAFSLVVEDHPGIAGALQVFEHSERREFPEGGDVVDGEGVPCNRCGTERQERVEVEPGFEFVQRGVGGCGRLRRGRGDDGGLPIGRCNAGRELSGFLRVGIGKGQGDAQGEGSGTFEQAGDEQAAGLVGTVDVVEKQGRAARGGAGEPSQATQDFPNPVAAVHPSEETLPRGPRKREDLVVTVGGFAQELGGADRKVAPGPERSPIGATTDPEGDQPTRQWQVAREGFLDGDGAASGEALDEAAKLLGIHGPRECRLFSRAPRSLQWGERWVSTRGASAFTRARAR